MNNILHFSLTDIKAIQILRECANDDSRVFFSSHARQRMRQRKITNTQVLYCLKNGQITEPLHQDIRGDWKCTLTSYTSGATINVVVAFKYNKNNECIVVITVF